MHNTWHLASFSYGISKSERRHVNGRHSILGAGTFNRLVPLVSERLDDQESFSEPSSAVGREPT